MKIMRFVIVLKTTNGCQSSQNIMEQVVRNWRKCFSNQIYQQKSINVKEKYMDLNEYKSYCSVMCVTTAEPMYRGNEK